MTKLYVTFRTYLFAILTILYVVGVFCAVDIRGHPNLYRVFLFGIVAVVALRCCARVPVLAERLEEAVLLTTGPSVRSSRFVWIGLEPDRHIAPEVLLLLATVWFISDRLATCRFFSAGDYHAHFSAILPSFPMDYCYGLYQNPSHSLGLTAARGPSVLDSLRAQFSRLGLTSGTHRWIVLVIDAVSFVLLMSEWPAWEAVSRSPPSPSDFVITYAFSVILTLYIAFMAAVSFCQLSCRYYTLFKLNLLWMAGELFLCAGYLLWGMPPGGYPSLHFFLFTRILSHIIVAQNCLKGKVFATFPYPRFSEDWRSILTINMVVHRLPFFFEIQTLLAWMFCPTKLSFGSFMLMEDAKLRLENLIARQTRPEAPHVGRRRSVVGAIALIAFLLIVFLPLALFSSTEPVAQPNPLSSATLEVDFEGTLPQYYSIGRVSALSSERRSVLASDSTPEVRLIAAQPLDTLFWAEFPRASVMGPLPVTFSAGPLAYRVKLSLAFTQPTGRSYEVNTAIIRRGIALVGAGIHSILPTVVSAAPGVDLRGYGVATAGINCGAGSCEFLQEYGVAVYSQPAPPEGVRAAVQTGYSGTYLAFYVILIIMAGVLVRQRTIAKLDGLWLKRIENPHKLYRMCVAVHLCRDAGDSDREAKLVKEFLDLMRSPEKVFALVKRD
jgi:hypothetical protein